MVSGDVSAVEQAIVRAKENGKGEWVFIPYAGGSNRFWIGPRTDVLIQYNNN